MIPPEQVEQIRKILQDSARPLFLFDDDPDGITSFVQLYKFCGEGTGVMVKGSPILSEMYLRKVEEHTPDVVFVLDKPRINPEFVEKCKVPIVWIDHHHPQEAHPKIRYFNPRIENPEDGTPTSYWCYQVARQHLWLAMTGIVGVNRDILGAEFSAKHPELLPPDIKRPQDALYGSKIGEFARLLSFVIKGKVSEGMNCVKILTRIDSPHEVLEETTPQGRYLYRRYKRIRKEYDTLVSEAESHLSDDKLLLFNYSEYSTSFTSELSNELIYRHPEKVVLVCRSRGGEMRCSIRSTVLNLNVMVDKALVGVEGYGGGHEHACGACVNLDDWTAFLESLREQLRTA